MSIIIYAKLFLQTSGLLSTLDNTFYQNVHLGMHIGFFLFGYFVNVDFSEIGLFSQANFIASWYTHLKS